MNTLSILIYLAELCEGLKTLGFAIALMGGIASVFMCIFAYAEDEPLALRLLRYVLPVSIVCLFLCVFVPSQKTIMMIAASEAGERLASNPDVKGTASDATKLLRQWIKSQLKDGKEKSDE